MKMAAGRAFAYADGPQTRSEGQISRRDIFGRCIGIGHHSGHLPGRVSKEIYMAPFNKYVFVVKNGTIELEYPGGSDRYVNLTLNRRELALAIDPVL
jgi:hypothetical protein